MYPPLVRHIVYPLLQWKAGGRVRPYLRELEQTQWLSVERLRELQWQHLRRLLAHAAAHVPYYRDVFRDRRLRPEDIARLEDLSLLPVLSKETLRDRPQAFRAETVGGRLIERRTSGSTGIPLAVHVTPHTRDRWEAAYYRARRWWGLDVGTRQAKLVNPHGKRRLTMWKQAVLANHVEFSVYELDDAALEVLYRRLLRARCELLAGYPSALTYFAHYLASRGLGRELRLRAVLTTAEVLYPDMRRLLQETFGCPVIDEYGSSECGFVAGECPMGSMHVAVENILLEYAPLPAGDGETPRCELLVTDLHNVAMPLIRYRIGDLGLPGAPCACGRGLPTLRLVAGRIEDLVVLPGGRKVDGSVFEHAVEALIRAGASVKQFRAIQHAADHIEVLVATDAPHHPALARLPELLQSLLGARVAVTVTPVARIPVEPGGKLRRFVSRVVPDAAPVRTPA